MNYQKLQTDLLKDLIKYPDLKDHTKRSFQGVAKYKNNIAVLSKYAIYIVPEEKFYLDYEKIVSQLKDFTTNIQGMLDIKYLKLKEAIKSNDTIAQTKNRVINIFEAGDIELYIDKKLISYYDSKKSYIYKIIDSRNALYIYDSYNELIGFILPINPSCIKK